jgi:hypothetical protein
LHGDPDFAKSGGVQVNGESRLDNRKVRDQADIAASAEIILVKVRGGGRYGRNQQCCRDRQQENEGPEKWTPTQHSYSGLTFSV